MKDSKSPTYAHVTSAQKRRFGAPRLAPRLRQVSGPNSAGRLARLVAPGRALRADASAHVVGAGSGHVLVLVAATGVDGFGRVRWIRQQVLLPGAPARFRSSLIPQTPMPKAVLVKRGEEHLPDVPLAELEGMYRHEPPGKSRDGLQAAVLRKRGKMIVEMATMSGRHPSTIHRWLHRLEREGPDGRYDRRGPGRPRRLTPEQIRYTAYRSGTPGGLATGLGHIGRRGVCRRKVRNIHLPGCLAFDRREGVPPGRGPRGSQGGPDGQRVANSRIQDTTRQKQLKATSAKNPGGSGNQDAQHTLTTIRDRPTHHPRTVEIGRRQDHLSGLGPGYHHTWVSTIHGWRQAAGHTHGRLRQARRRIRLFGSI